MGASIFVKSRVGAVAKGRVPCRGVRLEPTRAGPYEHRAVLPRPRLELGVPPPATFVPSQPVRAGDSTIGESGHPEQDDAPHAATAPSEHADVTPPRLSCFSSNFVEVSRPVLSQDPVGPTSGGRRGRKRAPSRDQVEEPPCNSNSGDSAHSNCKRPKNPVVLNSDSNAV